MVFASLAFVFLFLPAVLLLYWPASSRWWRNSLLLAVSLLFYAWGEPVYVLIIVLSILANWFFGLCIRRCGRESLSGKAWVLIGLVANLAPLAYFKYADFLVANFNALLHTRVPAPGVALPIGISFYTFQAISYLVDLYRGEIQAQANPLYYGMYHTLFPQLVAGPIVRYKTIEKEVDTRQESLQDFAAGLRRFVVGLGKKVLIANNMAFVAEHLLAAEPRTIGALPAWFGILAYTFQIYFDFSGYSDMAIGMGRMFGFHFMENFNYPYISKSVTEFWRRWHISLSTFFRDYVYSLWVEIGSLRSGGSPTSCSSGL